MKRTLIAASLGIFLNVATSHGQGYIIMENYKLVNGVTPVFSAISYGPGSGGRTGQYVGAASGFKADLLFSLDGGSTYSIAAGSETSFFPGSQDGGSPTTDGAGTFFGPTVTIPGYSSGPVSFIVEVGNGLYSGMSTPFTINSLNTNPALPWGDLLNLNGTTIQGLQPFLVPIPEPSMFALAGLGAAGVMFIRRRK